MAIALVTGSDQDAGGSIFAITPGFASIGCSILVTASAIDQGQPSSLDAAYDGVNAPYPLTERGPSTNIRGRLTFLAPLLLTHQNAHLVLVLAGGGPTACAVAGFSGVRYGQAACDTEAGGLVNAAESIQTSITPRYPDCLLFAMCSWNLARTVSIDAGFTLIRQRNYSAAVNYGIAIAYKVLTGGAGVAVAPTWSWTGQGNTDAVASIASFIPATIPVLGWKKQGPQQRV